tara:strand:- start:158 stop:475 length:318 start_codon:yes stop_codon:yes gene_type:complete
MKPQQIPMEFPPASHSNDPESSKEGAKKVTRSGKRSAHVKLVLDVVRAFPGSTAGKIGKETKLGHVRAQRRLSDLKNDGVVFISGKEKYKGNNQSKWYPTKSIRS